MIKIREIGKKARNLGNKLLLALALLHGATQLNYTANKVADRILPSPQNQAFQKEFGTRLSGYSSKEEGMELSKLAEVMQKERIQRPFELSSITIEPESYLQKSLLGQLDQLFFTPSSGLYCANRIWLGKHERRNVAHHEIKHKKTFEIIDKHPELLIRWSNIAKDEKGKSLYDSPVVQVCSRIKGLSSIVKRDDKLNKDNKNLGFVSDYARTNVYEDIAETCSELSDTLFDNMIEMLNSDKKGDKLIAKVKLAQEYSLLPPGIIEYARLKVKERWCWEGRGIRSKADVQEYFKESENFLRTNPNSIYESEIRESRAYIMSTSIMNGDYKQSREIAAKEFKLSLNSSYKDVIAYAASLEHLSNIYRSKENKPLTQLYENAGIEFWKRFHSGDIHLTSRGVNDLLSKVDPEINPN